jgi:Domain of unknown function (DUF4232)
MRTRSLLPAVAAVAATACAAVAAGQAGIASKACAPASLRYRIAGVEGAAGTTLIRLEVRTARLACDVTGYPSLALAGPGGRRLPTRVRHGGLAVLNRRVRAVAVSPRRAGHLLVAYNDVPVGAETSCPRGTGLVVGGVRVQVVTHACGHGRLLESPYIP